MTKHYRIHIKGEPRADIDADLMARLVVMLGRQLADDAARAIEAARAEPTIDRDRRPDAADSPDTGARP